MARASRSSRTLLSAAMSREKRPCRFQFRRGNVPIRRRVLVTARTSWRSSSSVGRPEKDQ